MSILIRGMEMPKSCWECPCEISYPSYGRSVCGVTSLLTDDNEDTRRDDCPLVPVPDHGRLIDADALMHEFEKAQRMREQHGHECACSFMSSGQEISTEWYCVEDMVENAPTIIEAEGAKE